jgi:hypothetical protein
MAIGSDTWAAGTTSQFTINSVPSITTQPSTTGQLVCQNSGSTALSVVATGVGLTYQWYSNTTASNSGGSVISGATSSSYTPLTTTVGTLYYYCIVSGTCSPAVTSNVSGAITINPLPATTTVSGAGTFCISTTITASNGSDGIMYFQGTTSNGTSTATPSSSQVITTSGTYYFRAQSSAGCWGTQGSATVTINNPAAPTGTASQTFCSINNPTVANLAATGTGIQWYAASSGGAALATTTALVSGTHYYASQTISGCEGTARFDVTATISNPAAPTGTASQTFCAINNPTVANLAATGTGIQWYAASSGGTALATTTALVSGTHYYASQTISGCEGTARFDVTVTISNPAAPTGTASQIFCAINNPTVANLAATGTAIKWYAASSGGTALATTTALVSGTHYYASQTVSGCEGTARFDVTATISNPAAPTGTASQTFCAINNPTVANLVATGTSIQWYAAASGGTALATTTALVNGTHYYASQTVSGCESATRLNVTATVSNPAAPTGTASQTFCAINNPTVANLAATGTGIQWYAASSGGTALATTTALVSGTHYYASQTISGCEGTVRFDVTVTVSNPAVPTGTASQIFCAINNPTVANLVATGTAIKWYAASSGGTALATTTALVDGTHYYASQTISGCESTTRLDVTATVSNSAAPTGTASQTFCAINNPTVANLAATGTAIKWYAASSGGTALATTTALVDGTHYYASQTISGCEGTARFDVTATVNNPAAPIGSAAQSFCSNNNPTVADLAATGIGIQWYAASSGGTALATTTGLVSGTHYYASQTVSGCEGIARLDVTATVSVPPAITNDVSTQSLTLCNTDPVTFTVTANGDGLTYQWYHNGTPLNDNSFVTGSTTSALTIDPTASTDAGTYHVVVHGVSPCTDAISTDAVLTIVQDITILSQPVVSQTVCEGDDATFVVSADPPGLAYQWRKSGVDIPGATSETLTITNVTASDAGSYRVVITDAGGGCPVARSNISTLVVNKKSLDPTSATAASPVICNGGSTTLTLSGGGGGTGEVITWYAGSCGGTPIGTGNGLSVSPTTTTTYYGRYEDGAPCNYNSICLPVTVTVNQKSADPTSASAPVTTICNGQSTILTLNGGGGGTNEVITWYAGSCGGTPVGTGNNLPVSPTTTTTYYGRYEDGAPCNYNSTCAFVTITVNQKPADPTSATASASPICNGSSVTLNLVGGGGGTGPVITWYSGSCGGTLIGTGNGLSVAPTTTTTYFGRYETSAPCSYNSNCASVTVTVNQKSADPVSATASATNICNGQSTILTLNGGGGGTGEVIKWYSTSCGTGLVGTGNNLSVAPTATTTYYGRYEDGLPCNNSLCASVTITVNQKPSNPTSATASSTNICAGTSVTLNLVGGGGGTGQVITWYSGSCGGTLVGTGNGLSVTPSTTTTYFGRYETSAPCSFNSTCASVTVNVSQAPTTSVAGGNQTICSTTPSVTLAANTPIVGTGVWSIVAGSPSTSSTQFSSTSNPAATFTPAGGAGTYTLTWTISNAPCTASSSSITITVFAPPTTANAGTNQDVCGLSTTLAANAATIGTGAWSVVSGPAGYSFGNTGSRTSSFSNASLTATGTYVLRWTISNGPCTASTSDVTIKLNPPITNDNIYLRTFCRDASTGIVNTILDQSPPGISGGNGTYTYVWEYSSTGNSSPTVIPGQTNSFLALPQGGTNYFYYRTVVSGPCSDSTTKLHVNLNNFPAASPLQVTPTTGTVSYCNGGPGILVGTNTSAPLTSGVDTAYYQLYLNGVAVGAPLIGTGSPLSFGYQTAAGTYTVTETIHVPAPQTSCTPATFINSLTINIDGNVKPDPVNAGTSQTVCAQATMAADAPIVGTGLWSIVSGSGTITTPTSPNTTVTALGTGANTLKWKLTNGTCADSNTVVITAYQPNVAPTALNATPTAICNGAGTNVTLTQTGGSLGTSAQWQWYSDPGFTTKVGGLIGAANASITVSPTTTTTYYIRAEGATAPCSAITSFSGSITITVNNPNVAPTVLNATSTVICNGAGTNVTLTQTGGSLGTSAQWQWYSDPGFTTKIGGLIGVANASITVSPTTTTTYYLRAEGATAPCSATTSSSGSITITVNNPSVAPTVLNATSSVICNGTSTTLTQTGGSLGTNAKWQWYSDPGYTTKVGGLLSTANASIVVSPTITTTYYIQAEGGAPCANTPFGSVTITVNNPSVAPTVLNATPNVICNGTSTTLTQTGGSLGTNAKWQWYSDPGYTTKVGGLLSTANAFLVVSPTTTTTYYVRAEGGAPCANIPFGSVTITVNNPSVAPTVLNATSNVICNGTSTTLTQTGGSLGTNAKWQWYSDPGYTTKVGGLLSTANASLTVSPTTTTTYYIQAEGGAPCANTPFGSITITVNDPPAITVQPSTSPGCLGGVASISASGGGTGVSYKWQISTDGGSSWNDVVNAAPYSGITSATLNVNPTTVAMSTYLYRMVASASNPCNIAAISNPIALALSNVWTGTVSSNWNDPNNWSDKQVPSAANFANCNTVTIPATPFLPQLTSSIIVPNLTILPGASLDLNGKTLEIDGTFSGSPTGYLKGSPTSGVTIGGNAGSLYFDPSNNYLKTLTVNSSSGATIGNALNIATGTLANPGTLIVNGSLDANANLTLKSDANGTAVVGQSNGTINNNVTVERYIPALRAWRFLTVPFSSSSQSVRDAWQEGVNNPSLSVNINPHPGYGTHITGNNNTSLGFDYNTTVNPSYRVWNANGAGWNPTEPRTDLTKITDYPAYCIFVRGSRAVNLSLATGATPDPTVLRATGLLNQNGPTATRTYSLTAAGQAAFIGNPYASPINLLNVIHRSSGIDTSIFWIWDPKIVGTGTDNVGAYVSYSHGVVAPTLPTPSYPDMASVFNLQSGQAFMVQLSSGSTSATMNFQETDKLTTQANVFGRPVAQSSPAIPTIYMNLMAPVGSGLFLADGVATGFGDKFSASVDKDDAAKRWNFDENLALVRNESLLAIEFRPLPALSDTLFYRMYLKQQPYVLKIFTQAFDDQPLRAWLVDKYLQTKTEVNLHDTTLYSFKPNPDTNSYRNRFMIVLNRQFTGIPVPVTKAANGENPNTTGVANNMATAPASGISIYPNPAKTGEKLNLRFNSMDKGRYEISITDIAGKQVSIKTIEHRGGSDNYMLHLSAEQAAGNYIVKVTNESGYMYTTKLVIAY